MKKIYLSILIVISGYLAYAQPANFRSGSTSNPEIENLGGFTPDINQLTPDNNIVGSSFSGNENTIGGTSSESDLPNAKENLSRNTTSLESLILSIYPNPATNYVVIEFDGKLVGKVILMNLVGQQMISTEINSSNLRLDLSAIPEGVYFLSIETATERVAKKIKVQK